MPSILKMLSMMMSQNLGQQRLARTPEPDAITAAVDNVLEYDRVMETKLAISYAVAVQTIYRGRHEPFGGHVIDIACGPGHLSLLMFDELRLDSLIGVDLSSPMVEVANKNARERGLDQVVFRTGNATELSDFSADRFDLATMMDAAHHLPSIDMVGQVLREMDRVTRSDGMVVLMDLVRYALRL